MSQYLIIFLIVAVFRGVVWVVQKVQQNAKAREALLAQQASAQMAAPRVEAQRPDRAPRSMTVDVAARARQVASPGGAAVTAPVRTPKPPQRGQAKRSDRGAMTRSRGGATPRTVGQPPGATAARVPSPSSGGWASARTPDRVQTGSQQAPAVRQTPAQVAPLSRADIREARVGQSSRDVRKLLLDRGSLRQALLAREILGPPRGLTA